MKISDKVPAEVIPVTFDFSEMLPAGTVIDSVVQTGVVIVTGTDASAATMLYGTSILTGLKVVQLIRNGVAAVKYNLSCLVAVGNERYQIDTNMDVVARHSR